MYQANKIRILVNNVLYTTISDVFSTYFWELGKKHIQLTISSTIFYGYVLQGYI